MANFELTVAVEDSGLSIGDVIKVVQDEYILIVFVSGGQQRFNITRVFEPVTVSVPNISVVEYKYNIQDVDNPETIFGNINFFIVNSTYIHFKTNIASLLEPINPKNGSGGGLVSVGS